MKQRHFNPSKSRGAALIVGMILLFVITLLAISGMSASSTELIMAGNEQYRQRANQAAEIGIEQSLRVLSTLAQDGVPVVVAPQPVAATPDTWQTRTQYLGEDADIPGYSQGKFVGFHYQILATGNSSRNAQSVHEQGAYVLGSTGGNSDTFGSIN